MVVPPISPLTPVTPPTPAGAGASAAQGSGSGFGSMLAGEMGKLDTLQQQATTASQQLATGQATDVSTVAMEVERASLALQLATQVRNKAVEAYQNLMQTQV
jgi:flagellar hook-basal body complex protein FliE